MYHINPFQISFNYEAAVCGGIPIIHSLHSDFLADRITKIRGIMNGTVSTSLFVRACVWGGVRPSVSVYVCVYECVCDCLTDTVFSHLIFSLLLFFSLVLNSLLSSFHVPSLHLFSPLLSSPLHSSPLLSTPLPFSCYLLRRITCFARWRMKVLLTVTH